MKPITVLLAEDHAVVRDGLRALLVAEPDIEVIGEAATGREAVQRTRELAPAVVVMDIAMPLLNGLEAARQILKAAPATRIIMLSAHGDDEYVEQAVEVGAAGFLLKQTPFLVLAQAIREASNGKPFFSAGISDRLLERVRGGGHPAKGRKGAHGSVPLTSREVEVLQLIAEGKANKQTAAELGISMKTVEKHRQHLMSKLDIHDTAGLTRYAIAAGIIEGAVRITTE
jgi:DNA-binding NarL/FixJ family response regulator